MRRAARDRVILHMTFTKPQVEACRSELQRCAGRRWVSVYAVPEPAWKAFERLGWGAPELFTDHCFTERISGDEVALAAAFVIACHSQYCVREEKP